MAEYKKYADQVPGIMGEYGAKALARGGRFQIMEGPQKFERFVVSQFPTFEQAVACFNSEEYKKAAAFRRGRRRRSRDRDRRGSRSRRSSG